MGQGYQQVIQDHYDALTGSSQGGRGAAAQGLTPFPFVARDDESKLLEWHQNTIDALEDEQIDRAINQVNNINFYHGLQKLAQDSSTVALNWAGKRFSKQAEFVMNHARDFAHQKLARLMRFSPRVNVSPVNNEYKDRLGARTSKRVVDNIFYLNEAEDLFRSMVLEAILCGESFVFPVYDTYAGDKDPEIEARRQAMAAEAAKVGRTVDELSLSFENSRGELVSLQIVKRTGEVKWVQPLPWFVFFEPKFRWRDVNYIYYIEIKHIDEVRAENPGVPLDAARPFQLYSSLQSKAWGPEFKYGEYVLQYNFYHKHHPFLDSGWYCKFIPGAILRSEKLPYSTKELPVARFTDWDDPMNAHGVSFFEDLKPPLVLQNKMLGLMYRNIAIANHPKLLVPEGACNIQSMANGPLVVEYTYPMKPEILSFNSNGQDIFAVSEKFMGQTTQLSGTFDVSRGGTVPNARAASILNFYEEQEEQRESTQITKFSRCVEKVARLSLGIAGDFYQADDGRTVRVVGARNRYKLRKLEDISKLSGPYDIKVERTTALAESKQGRIDQIVQLSTMPLSSSQGESLKPGLFTREQVLRMLEVADTPTFFEMATAAVEKQESENEDMFEGLPVNAPEKWEAHEVCWNVLFQFMQSREFLDTKDLPAQVKDSVLAHMKAHELFMYDKARVSLTYAQELALNTSWPCVLTIGPGAKPPFDLTLNQLIQQHMAPPPPPMGAPVGDLAAPPMGASSEPLPVGEEPDVMPPEPMEEGEDPEPEKATRRGKRDPIDLNLNIRIKKGASKRRITLGPVGENGKRDVEVLDDTLDGGAVDL